MRLTYSKKSKNIRDKTLAQMRELRARFEEEHPELLQRIKDEVKSQNLYDARQEHSGNSNPDADRLVIDRKKNLMTVMALVKGHDGSDSFQHKLKKILLDVSKEI